MIQDFIVLHQKGSLPDITSEENEVQWLRWKTCIREVAFGKKSWMSSLPADFQFDLLTGADAYQFCLEIICGLHSPLVGETEILGQFRQFCEKSLNATDFDPAWSRSLKRIFEMLLTDAKAVRHQHLSNLGSQSYGSIARKFLSGTKEVHILGAGQLCAEMLPWLSGFPQVKVFCRNPSAAKNLEKSFRNVRVLDLKDRCEASRGSLVVAAPLSSLDIESWIAQHSHGFGQILDLRGESAQDPIKGIARSMTLKDVFENLEKHQSEIQNKVAHARREIERLAGERSRTLEVRPFGWDDLCA